MSTEAAAGYRSYAGDDVVTGEGVAVELPVATIASRIGAALIDVLAMVAILVIVAEFLGSLLAQSSEAVARVFVILGIVGTFVVLPAVVETLTRGRSLGKLALGLRIVRDDGGPITARQAIARALVGFVEIWTLLGGPAVLSAMLSKRGKRLGDFAAGTFAVTERTSMALPRPPQMPPMLQPWAERADIAVLPAGLAIAIRQFLARAGQLSPASRAALGTQLLDSALPHVAPAPPKGAHPEYILAAIIAERRRRDLGRLAREDARRRRVLPPDRLG